MTKFEFDQLQSLTSKLFLHMKEYNIQIMDADRVIQNFQELAAMIKNQHKPEGGKNIDVITT